MHGNESLECKNKILNAFKDNTFSSEYFKNQIMLLMILL